MKIAILNYEKPWFILASTSLVKSLMKQNHEVYYFTSEENAQLFKYDKKINLISGYSSDDRTFDVLINYSPTLSAANFCANINAKEKYGFTEINGDVGCIDKNALEFYDVVHCGQKSHKCIFQLLYKVANRVWKGEGYSLSYYPKNQTIKTNTGISIVNKDLREYLKNNLNLLMSDIYVIPNKDNLFKKLDEINKCMNIITDDLFTMHAAISLRKNVDFLDTNNIKYKLEFFGKGNHHRIIDGIWANKTKQNRNQIST